MVHPPPTTHFSDDRRTPLTVESLRVTSKLASFMALLATPSAAACPYTSLPTWVANVQVCDTALCGATSSGPCVVDKSCRLQTASSSFQAIGNFVACTNEKLMPAPTAATQGLPMDLSMAVFANSIVALYLDQMTLDFSSSPPTWPKTLENLSDLALFFLHIFVPCIPSPPNGSCKFPKYLKFLEVWNSNWTDLTYFNGSAQDVNLFDNPNMRRLPTLLENGGSTNVVNMHVTSWVLINNVFLAQNKMAAGRYGSVAGYDLNGTIKEVFTNKAKRQIMFNNDTYSQTTFTVCVLSPGADVAIPQPNSTTNTTTTPSPTATGMSDGITTGQIVAIALGAIAAVGIAAWCCRAKKQKQHVLGATPMILHRESGRPSVKWEGVSSTRNNATDLKQQSQPSTGELDMRGLELCRIQDKDVQLHHIIGAGAFADVWSGRYRNEPVAIKQLQAKNVTMHQLQSFVDEIHLMSTFNSPYIVQFIGAAWEQPKDMKCVMELMDGGDLRDYLTNHNADAFPWEDKLVHIQRIADALVYLHSLSVIHRDLKSRNVLLDSTKGTKLTDFGVSKEDMEATMTMGVGTFRWMAPEVIKSHKYTVSSDIYSFGTSKMLAHLR
ncbi:Aste57867_18472 [Aphanomyces stellatus]|uniref:Aste57867_18472 protein n=1 Tax=Aphanomyces stellatus TaxID=120398 RepID=A0A485LAS2_9STRA|nr:hypothetical protein As57867_018410 [Aphanomyces stellatus]VFT95208.1 Aste57867_18472 [Aphanomyces stellatus]